MIQLKFVLSVGFWRRGGRGVVCALAASAIGCGADAPSADGGDRADVVDAVDAADAGAVEAPSFVDESGDASADASKTPFVAAEYITTVVSHTVGPGGGKNEDKLPDIVLGPPHGGGCCAGSTDVYSLGNGGEIVVEFTPAIVDGPGVDLLVFENPFEMGADPTNVFAELGEVSVSEDGVTWHVFSCTKSAAPPYGSCAGWHPVFATEATGVNVNDPASAGGDPFDLADLGVKRARYVRVRDARSDQAACCKTAGFDLDAMAAIHWEK